ncbi:hypothetical protein [Shinella oryzae]|uniref:hypothetical protein n=1 Tax=Shinella oryzae TaxID=2871820 RepID=UPI001FF108FB|nr:hypothetical protein [Shinella oryzae]UPA25537.1 hypothetical protein K6301_04880 [Shinella oryzae]
MGWCKSIAIKLANAATWSSLAAIGESPMIKLTITVPFLGYLILYNDYVLSLLNVSFAHLRQLSGVDPASTQAVTMARINLLYFGLTALGIASFIYTLFTPRDVARHRTAVEYLQFVLPASTPAALERSIFQTIDEFGSASHSVGFALTDNLQFPLSLQQDLYKLMEQAHGKMDADDAFGELMNGAGYMNYTPMLETLYMRNAASKHAVAQFKFHVPELEKDIWQLEFERKNHTWPVARLLSMAFYSIGFALLFYPSVELTVRLLLKLFYA